MATASDNPDVSIRVMEEGLTCYICYNFLREPKDLDCPHVYCLQCLQEWTKKKLNVECPECRYITAVPQGGLVNLRTNLRLKNMVENYVEGKNITQKHVLMCPNHDGERQHFFCITCDIAVCQNCLVLDHPKPQHEIKDLQVIVQSLKEKLDHVQKEIETIKKQKQELSEMERKLTEQHLSLVDQLSKLYPSKQSPRTISIYKPDTSKAYTSQTEIPLLDSLQINPVTSQQKKPQMGYVDANSKGTCKLTFLSKFGEFKLAYSAASTRTGLFAVVDFENSVVSIYQIENDGFKYQYSLGTSRSNGNITRPLNVATTSDGKFLVSDYGVVKVFSPAGRYERSWSESIVADRITTTPDDLIVIGSGSKRVITVHHSNGELIRTHQANCADIDITSNGKQIAFTTQNPSKVCVIDFVTGQTLWTLDMVMPGGICYEQKSNTIFVAWGGSDGPGHDVIDQYCSTTGRFVSRLESGLYAPYGMTVTHDRKLVVADKINVKVYSIQ